MRIFDEWLPQKLVAHGDRLVEAALDLLATYGFQLSASKRDQAHDWLDYAEDHKQILNEKHLLACIKLARLYVRRANEALQVIQAMVAPQAVNFSRPTRS